VIPNLLLERLSKMYKKECIMKRNVKEVVQENTYSQETDLLELPKDLNDKGKYEDQNLAKVLEGYTTDDEDLQILEESLGLRNIEQELHENEKAPIESFTPSKQQNLINPAMMNPMKGQMKPMPMPKPMMNKLSAMPKQMMGRMGMPSQMNLTINPAMISSMPLLLQYMQNFPNMGNMPMPPQFMTPEMMNMLMKQKHGKGSDKDRSDKSRRSGSDRDKQKHKRRDKKSDRKNDKYSD